MISQGIPDRAGWPGGLLDHLRLFRQGDLVEGFPPVYLGNPDVAVHARTSAYAGEEQGPIEFPAFDYGMIVSQTCDLREEGRERPVRPWVHLVPVYDGRARYEDPESEREHSVLPSNVRAFVERGRIGYFLHLPDFGASEEFWVADFRIVTPVEKGWLLGRQPIAAFLSADGRKQVGSRMASLHSRSALDPRFENSVSRPLVAELKRLENSDLDLLLAIYDQVSGFGVRSDDDVQMTCAEVWVVCKGPLSDEVEDWLESQQSLWQANAETEGLSLLQSRVEALEDMSALEYQAVTELDLSHVTDLR